MNLYKIAVWGGEYEEAWHDEFVVVGKDNAYKIYHEYKKDRRQFLDFCGITLHTAKIDEDGVIRCDKLLEEKYADEAWSGCGEEGGKT